MQNPVMVGKDPNRKGIRFKDDELELFTEAMKRDGMSQLTTWMKSVCSKYATGQLVPLSMATADDKLTRLLLQSMAANGGKLPLGIASHATDMHDDPEEEFP